MIKNEKQLLVAKRQIERYQNAIKVFDALEQIERGLSPVLANAQLASYRQQERRLSLEIEAYNELSNNDNPLIPIDNVDRIGESLVRCRISRGWSQKKLARFCGLKEQQIQRYEQQSYRTASSHRLSIIIEALGARFDGHITLEVLADQADSNAIDISKWPLAEINRKNWLVPKLNMRSASYEDKLSALSTFLVTSSIRDRATALHKKTRGSHNESSRTALLLWEAEARRRADRLKEDVPPYNPLSSEDLQYLVKLSSFENGIIKAIDFLRSKGIVFVYLERLEKTKLDGACFVINNNMPVLVITGRHDRIDNFWFVLFHELGHIKLHWDLLVEGPILDESVGDKLQNDKHEDQADEFAHEAIISNAEWEMAFVRHMNDEQAIIQYAARRELHPALVAGRIRFEQGYSHFNDLIGRGDVRPYLARAAELGKA